MKTPLPESEWNFESCPPDELFHCWMWEYSRECPLIIEAVKNFREGKKSTTFFDLWPDDITAATVMGCAPPFAETIFSCSPEWHNKSYLSLAYADRRTRIEFAPRGLDILDEVAIKKLTTLYPTGRFQDVAFEIDWSVRDGPLIEQFKNWLKTARPSLDEVPCRETRGKGSRPAQLRKELKAIGAWRLIRDGTKHLSCLYDDESGWHRARKLAEVRISKFDNLKNFF